MTPNDVDGDGRSEIVITSPWGIGVIGLNSTNMSSQMLKSNGSRIGQWLLQTRENQFGPIANYGGNAKMEILAKSGWGIGLLRLASTAGESPLMAPNGTRFGGWLLNTANDEFGPTGDFDGDGLSELIVSSGWGLGILKQTGKTFSAPFMAGNGTKLGDWMLNSPDNRFGPIGDFDGDGHDEILVQSLWGIGILKYSNGDLRSIAMLPNGTTVSGWMLDVNTCRFLAVGDFDRDGRAEILAVEAGGVAILKLSGDTFTVLARIRNQTYCGGWMLNSAGDRFGPVADFDGDGVPEILVSSGWGLGVLKLSGSTLTSIAIAANGTWLGDWMLNTRDNRLNKVGHFSGAASAEILASSGWGAGILKVSGQSFTSVAMASNQTKLGDWRLNTADNDLEHGDQQCHAVIIYHSDWGSSVENTVVALRKRGYTVHLTDDGAVGLNMLRLLSLNLKAGDRAFVYLAGHGNASRGWSDFTKAASDSHSIYLNSGRISTRDISPIFSSLGNRNVDLTVFDGSCEGGETVHRASGERYTAMATTGLWSPAYINTPDPSGPVNGDTKPGHFGLWWDQPHIAGSWVNGRIMEAVLANGPQRLHQRLHRNDVTPLARNALMSRTAICNLCMPGSTWWLEVLGCHLLKYIRSDLTAAQRAALTTSTEDYINQVQAVNFAHATLLRDYKRFIGDPGTIHQAGFVYVANFENVWRTIANDPAWDVRNNPTKHRDRMAGVVPNWFRPEEAFKRLANQALNTILVLEDYYRRQISLLKQMDSELRKRWRVEGVPVPSFKIKNAPKTTWQSYLKRNAFDRVESERLGKIHAQMKIKPDPVIKLLERAPVGRTIETMKLPAALTNRLSKVVVNFDFRFPDMDKVRHLAAQINAISADQYWHLWRLNILLGVVEDAIVAVQARNGASPSELTNY